MSRKELPINLDAKLKIECWTYYKMAIIYTLPNYMNWLSSHMNIYFGEIGEGVYFGKNARPHSPEYFKDILTIEEIDLYAVSVTNVVDVIKEHIDNQYYYVIFTTDDNNISHETFIYGYDDYEKVFLTIALRDGKFAPTKVSYEKIEKGYKNELNYFKMNPSQYYMRRDYGYVMSKIKTNDMYVDKNYAYEFFEKIYYEVYGTRTDINDNYEIGTFEYTASYYTGISCLSILKYKLLQLKSNYEITDNILYDLKVLRINLYKLLENRTLLLDSMKWYEEKWKIDDIYILNLRREYKNCYEKARKICYMFLKYEQTKSIFLLDKIINELSELYKAEKKTLGEYAILIRQWYTENTLPKLLEYIC